MMEKKSFTERLKAHSAKEIADYALYRAMLILPVKDETFLRIQFKQRLGYKPDFVNPQSYNEKLNWLKMHNKCVDFTVLVDKDNVKKKLEPIIGKEHIIPTLAVYDSVDEIDFDKLPDRFVLKPTHDSGTVVICKDRLRFDVEAAKEQLRKSLKRKYWKAAREYPYKGVKPCIIQEPYLEDESCSELKDYKFFCFNGEPRLLYVASGRHTDLGVTFDFYDMDFNPLPFTNGHPRSGKKFVKPAGFDTMVGLSRKLSKGITHVRCDFYDVNGQVLFGEMTFFHMAGLTPFCPREWDYKIGKLIQLPNTYKDEHGRMLPF